MAQTSNEKAIDSIELQIAYYEKQLKLLNLRKTFCQTTEKQKNTDDDDVSYLAINEHVEKTTEIQLDLLKNLEDSYKIIEELNSVGSSEVSSQVSQLQNLNSQLNLMFHKLSVSIEEVLRENELLRDKAKLVDDPKTATCNISEKDFEKDNENSEQQDSDDSSQELQDLPALELPTFNIDDK